MAINRDVDWSYTAIYSKCYSNKIVSNAKKNIKFNNSSFISINITIIGCRKNGNNCRKILHPIPFIHFITFNLCFMSSNNRQKIICLKELINSINSIKIRTTSNFITPINTCTNTVFIINWIRPK